MCKILFQWWEYSCEQEIIEHNEIGPEKLLMIAIIEIHVQLFHL